MIRTLRFVTFEKTLEINYENNTYKINKTMNKNGNKNYIITSKISFDSTIHDLKKAKFKQIREHKYEK